MFLVKTIGVADNKQYKNMQSKHLMEERFHYQLLDNCIPFYFGKVLKKIVAGRLAAQGW